MRNFIKQSAIVSVSLGALVLGSASAQAQQAASGDVADIVVTAQKRPEKMQDIPVAVSVISADAVAAQHIEDLSDINKAIPSVEMKATFNGRVPYGLRGISTNANEGAIGLTSGVNIQVDGIPVPADSFAANTISDVAQLEVLKGPQATLGGRTASAGEINFVTFGPTRTLKAAASVVVTDDKETRVDARVSGPLSEMVSFSLSGYYGRTPYPVYNLLLNQQSAADNGGVRGKLKFDLSSDFDITLMGHWALATSRGENFVYQYITPGATLLAPAPFMNQAAMLGTNYTPHYGNTIYNSPVDMGSRYEDTDGSVVANYRFGGWTLTSTTAYFYEKQYQSQDLFLNQVYFFDVLTGGHAPHFNNMQSDVGYVRQTTQEFKLASDASKPLSALVGAYYNNSTVSGFGLRSFVGFPASQINVSNTKSFALYGRVTEKFNDQVSFIGGLRYNHDKIGWAQTDLFDPTQAWYGTNNFGLGGWPTWNLSSSKDTLVGDASLQYHFDRRTMAYVSYTRGYKPAAYNTAHSWAEAQSALAAGMADNGFTTPTKGETIDSVELGLKSSSMGGRLTFNADVFYTNYANYQAQLFDTSQLVGILVLSSAGARTEGAEADLTYRDHDSTISLAAAYIDAKFKNFPGAQCYPLQTAAQGCVNGAQNLSGAPLPDSPKFKFDLNVQHTIPMDKFNIVLGGNLSYRTSAFFQADQNPQTYQGNFALVDASIGIQSLDKKLALTLFANNITNHFYLTNAEDFFAGPWSANAVIGQPARDSHRYFGARASVNF